MYYIKGIASRWWFLYWFSKEKFSQNTLNLKLQSCPEITSFIQQTVTRKKKSARVVVNNIFSERILWAMIVVSAPFAVTVNRGFVTGTAITTSARPVVNNHFEPSYVWLNKIILCALGLRLLSSIRLCIGISKCLRHLLLRKHNSKALVIYRIG